MRMAFATSRVFRGILAQCVSSRIDSLADRVQVLLRGMLSEHVKTCDSAIVDRQCEQLVCEFFQVHATQLKKLVSG